MSRVALAILMAMVAAALSPAAPAEARPGHRVAQGGPDKRAHIKQRLRTLRDDALIAEIPLDAATAARLLPVLARHDEARARFHRDGRRLRRALEVAIAAGEPRAIDSAVDDLVAHRRGRMALDEARLRDARAVLTPAQAARLFLTLPAIERRLQRRLRGFLGRHRGPRSAPGDDGAERIAPPR